MNDLPNLSAIRTEITPVLNAAPSSLRSDIETLTEQAHALHSVMSSLKTKLTTDKTDIIGELIERRDHIPTVKPDASPHPNTDDGCVLAQMMAASVEAQLRIQADIRAIDMLCRNATATGMSEEDWALTNPELIAKRAAALARLPKAPTLYAEFQSGAATLNSPIIERLQTNDAKLISEKKSEQTVDAFSRNLLSLMVQNRISFGKPTEARSHVDILLGTVDLLAKHNDATISASRSLLPFAEHYETFAALPSTNMYVADMLLGLRDIHATTARIHGFLSADGTQAPQTAAALKVAEYFAPISGLTPRQPIAVATPPQSQATLTTGSGVAGPSL